MAETHLDPGTARPAPAVSGRWLKRLEITGWVLVLMLIALGLSSVLTRGVFLVEAMLDPDAVFNAFDVRYVEHPLATLFHLVPSLVIAVVGPLQFVRRFRQRQPLLHRLCGRAFVICGLVAAASGFYVGVFYPFGGLDGPGFNQAVATTVFAAFTAFCLVRAYLSIRARNIAAHREWMIRSWALMLAIATERTFLGLLLATTNVDMTVLFGTTFWMAGVLNVAVAEVWINLTRTPGRGARHWKDAIQPTS